MLCRKRPFLVYRKPFTATVLHKIYEIGFELADFRPQVYSYRRFNIRSKIAKKKKLKQPYGFRNEIS